MSSADPSPKKKSINQYRAQQQRAQKQRDQMMVIGVAVLAVVLFIGILVVALTSANQPPVKVNTQSAYASIPQSADSAGAPILGNANAKVTLMEFADFSCPHCREYKPIIKSVIETYVSTGKARLIFQPMTFVGQQYSVNAAIAALCANKQNAFWDMYDAIYQVQATAGATAYTDSLFNTLSTQLKLDTNAFASCYQKLEPTPALTQAENLFSQFQPSGLDGVPGLLYSLDGKSFQFFKDSSGNNVAIPPLELISKTLDPLVQ